MPAARSCSPHVEARCLSATADSVPCSRALGIRAKESEAFLTGKSLQADVIAQAAELATKGAKPLASNEYKIQLAEGLVRQALTRLSA